MRTVPLLTAFACAAVFISTRRLHAQQPDSAGLTAFRAVTSVLMSPRCVNCHIAGDAPLQGDDGHTHIMRIKRGADGRGTPAVQCRTCHQTTNSAALHGPPGVDGWRLPPRETPMAWHGVSPGALCRNLKTPSMTGGRSLAQLAEHVNDDRLVKWAWEPGPGRSVPPMPHVAFVEAFRTWVQAGAPCPAEESPAR
jgi:hypothetical protein